MRALLAIAALTLLGSPAVALAGPCDVGCTEANRQECLGGCEKKTKKSTAATCKADCDAMAKNCKKICEAAMRHPKDPEAAAAAVKDAMNP